MMDFLVVIFGIAVVRYLAIIVKWQTVLFEEISRIKEVIEMSPKQRREHDMSIDDPELLADIELQEAIDATKEGKVI